MSNNINLMDVLFPTARQGVLAVLLLQPETNFHLRELARLTNSHAATLGRELEKLTQAGLLLRSEQGNQVRYQANVQHPLFEDLAAMFRKTHGVVPLLREALQALDKEIHLAFVYGSTARGAANEHSDIDLLVLGDLPFAELVQAVHPLQAMLTREINPVLYAPDDFAQRLVRGDGFARELMDKPKLWIKGTDNDLAKLAVN